MIAKERSLAVKLLLQIGLPPLKYESSPVGRKIIVLSPREDHHYDVCSCKTRRALHGKLEMKRTFNVLFLSATPVCSCAPIRVTKPKEAQIIEGVDEDCAQQLDQSTRSTNRFTRLVLLTARNRA